MSQVNALPKLAATPAPATAPRGVAVRLGELTGTRAVSKLSADRLVRDGALGAVSSVPFEALFEAGAYRRGEVDARTYVAKVLSNSIGFASWTAGGALAAAAIAPLGLPGIAAGAIGFAAGMIANDLFDRLCGPTLKAELAARLPEKACKAFAEPFTRYVAAPLTDYIWKPVSGFVMQHKVLTGAALFVAACRFPLAAKALGREAATWVGGGALAMGVSIGLLDRVLPAADHGAPEAKGAKAPAKAAHNFRAEA